MTEAQNATKPQGVTEPEIDAMQFWEARYGDTGLVWSGRPNQVLVSVVDGLPAGSALDLGCGEGADSIWLSSRGWQVTGVDISSTALARAADAAAQGGLPSERIRWLARDLAFWQGEGSYDLVSACFLHSPVEFPRADVLRRAAGMVAPGGHLLIVSHAAFPPWSDVPDHHEHRFLTPAEEVGSLGLSDVDWQPLIVETRPRQGTGPNGELVALDDSVVLVRRR